MAQHCRICGLLLNLKEDDWIKPVNNYYYHRDCYNKWKKSDPAKDEEYEDLIYDFIKRDMHFDYDYWKCETQLKKFKKDGMTLKGVFFALKYFYEVCHGDWSKGHGGIGIVPYIYEDSYRYWARKEQEQKGAIAEIEQQMLEAHQREVKKVLAPQPKKKKKEVDLSVLGEMEDEEW